MNRLAYRLVLTHDRIWLAAVFTCAIAGSASSIDAPELGLAANDQVLWVFHRRAEADGTPLLRMAYTDHPGQPPSLPTTDGQAASKPLTFWPLRIPPIEGGITHAAARQTSLHVFYRDGTHKRYLPGAQAWDVWPSPSYTNEWVLPRSAPPLLLATDDRNDALYALITSAQAREFTKVGNDTLDDASNPDDPQAAESIIEKTRPDPPAIAIPEDVHFVIARYDDAGWTVDRLAPPLRRDDTPMYLWARGGAIHLVFREHSSGAMTHSTTAAPQDFWSDPIRLPLDTTPVTAAAGWEKDHPVLLVAERRPYGITAYSLRRVQETWKLLPMLTDEKGAPVSRGFPVAVAVFSGRAAMAWLNEDRSVQVGLWSLETGRPEGTALVEALKPEQAIRPSPRATLMLEYAVLSAILAAVFFWRRDSVAAIPILRSDQQLAPAVRRLAAFAVDVALLFPLWATLFYLLILSEDRPINETLAMAMDGAPTRLRWYPSLLGAIVGLYGWIMESTTGATVGKRITGLTVLTFGGEPCGIWSALTRNAIRIVEFQFAPLVLLVALTPARQRLGDIIARTVVIATRDPAPREASGG